MDSKVENFLGRSVALDDSAELLHAAPAGLSDELWGDTMWLSALDPSAGIIGVNHMHVTNRGYARFQCHYWIDGVRQSYACRSPFVYDAALTSWSAGHLRYEVLEPFRSVRLTMDGPRFGFDLIYESRFPPFDYDDCRGGNPLWIVKPVAASHGGHYEQAALCRGTFEIRGGPSAGQTRSIDCLAHRDHTWSDRFAALRDWDEEDVPDAAMHFWLVLQFPEREFQGIGFFDPAPFGGYTSENTGRAGCESSERGNRNAIKIEPIREYEGTKTAQSFRTDGGPDRWRYTFSDGEVCTIRATRRYGTVELIMRGENDAENTLSDYEDIVDLEIEETGERGYGVIEYSVLPPRPRWVC